MTNYQDRLEANHVAQIDYEETAAAVEMHGKQALVDLILAGDIDLDAVVDVSRARGKPLSEYLIDLHYRDIERMVLDRYL